MPDTIFDYIKMVAGKMEEAYKENNYAEVLRLAKILNETLKDKIKAWEVLP